MGTIPFQGWSTALWVAMTLNTNGIVSFFLMYLHDASVNTFCTYQLYHAADLSSVQLTGHRHRVYWNEPEGSGVNIPFDGHPYISVGYKEYVCQHGPDRHKKAKEKRRLLVSSQKV